MIKRDLGWELKQHFKDNWLSYFLVSIFLLVGIGIGLYISLTGYKYTSLLSGADKHILDYITGAAAYTSIFYSRLLNIIVCFLIILVLSLSKYSSFLAFIFLSYQTALATLSCAALITLYGLSGILNVILFVIPINLANFIALSFELCVNLERANARSRFRLGFFESFKENGFVFKIFLSLILLVVVCLFHSFILPIFLKSFVVVSY